MKKHLRKMSKKSNVTCVEKFSMAFYLTNAGRQRNALGNTAISGSDLVEHEIPDEGELLMDMVGRCACKLTLFGCSLLSC